MFSFHRFETLQNSWDFWCAVHAVDRIQRQHVTLTLVAMKCVCKSLHCRHSLTNYMRRRSYVSESVNLQTADIQADQTTLKL